MQEKISEKKSNIQFLILAALIIVLAIFSLLPRKPRLYTAYPLSDGIRLEGKIWLPTKNGEGVIHFPDKVVYRGAFTAGHLDGKAQAELDPTCLFTGAFKEGSLVSGEMEVKAEGIYVLQDDGSWTRKVENKQNEKDLK